jgi:hypothetical protein
MKDKVTCTFVNLTPAQAKALAEWYEGQGEQQADDWFDIVCEDRAPYTDVGRVGGYREIDEDGNVIVHCR